MSGVAELTLADRVFARVESSGDCLLWTGAKNNPNGYGVIGFRNNGKLTTAYVHRLAYEGFHGPIPADCEIHHLCERRTCVNPEHLIAVTHVEHGKYHRTATETRGIACPHCGEDEWLHRYYHGRPNGWRCATCHATRARTRLRTPAWKES